MEELLELLKRIAANLEEMKGNGITVQEAEDLFSRAIGPSINFYPGRGTDKCSKAVIILSLNPKGEYAKGRGHLIFETAIETVVQHMQGHCHGITQEAVILTDTWDPQKIGPWKSNLKVIRNRTNGIDKLKILLLSGGKITEMAF